MNNLDEFNNNNAEIYAGNGLPADDLARVEALNKLARFIPSVPNETINVLELYHLVQGMPASSEDSAVTIYNEARKLVNDMLSLDMNKNPCLRIGAKQDLLDGLAALNQRIEGTSFELTQAGKTYFQERLKSYQVYVDMSHGGLASISAFRP